MTVDWRGPRCFEGRGAVGGLHAIHWPLYTPTRSARGADAASAHYSRTRPTANSRYPVQRRRAPRVRSVHIHVSSVRARVSPRRVTPGRADPLTNNWRVPHPSQAGLALFPSSAFVSLLHSNFLIEVSGPCATMSCHGPTLPSLMLESSGWKRRQRSCNCCGMTITACALCRRCWASRRRVGGGSRCARPRGCMALCGAGIGAARGEETSGFT